MTANWKITTTLFDIERILEDIELPKSNITYEDIQFILQEILSDPGSEVEKITEGKEERRAQR